MVDVIEHFKNDYPVETAMGLIVFFKNYLSSEASMVKEDPVTGECSSHLASSKNAKEKSNSSTLRAMRKNKDSDDRIERGSRCSSEKDSGYSGELK